jgi:hypothetical protein
MIVAHLVKNLLPLLWNPKTNCRIYNSQRLGPTLSQINPVYLLTSCIFLIHCILSSTLSFSVLYQATVSYECYMSHRPWFYYPNKIW